jgi:hypothetical protein
VNLLVDLDRGEICNIKQDETRLERTVFSFEIPISKLLLRCFQGTPIFMAHAIRAGKPHGTVGRHAEPTSVPELSQMAHAYGSSPHGEDR